MTDTEDLSTWPVRSLQDAIRNAIHGRSERGLGCAALYEMERRLRAAEKDLNRATGVAKAAVVKYTEAVDD